MTVAFIVVAAIVLLYGLGATPQPVGTRLTLVIVGTVTLGLAAEAAHLQVGIPYWGVALFILLAGAATAAASGNDQELVLFYAVSVFLSFLAGLVSMAAFSYREHRRGYLLMNIAGALVVGFTLVANLSCGLPIASLAAALAIAAILYRAWSKAGRPRGIRNVAAEAETEPEPNQGSPA